jgi:decaprenylphospho-beta-D-erythro-pentofuranosid-2-ulose 2-reductase
VNDAFGRPQSVVVLGGTSDIAGAVVDKLVAARCRTVVLAARDDAALAAAANRARAGGAEVVETVTFDAADTIGAEATVARCFDAVDTVDLVLITVGALGGPRGDVLDAHHVREMAAVNYTWPATALAAAARRMRTQGHGRIVVLSSVAAVRARPATFIYGAAKGALDRFAAGLGETLRGSGVELHIVRPGFVHSKMTEGLRPAPFAISPETVAAALIRGMETGQRVIWVPGLLRWLYLILRHLPQSVWRRLPG